MRETFGHYLARRWLGLNMIGGFVFREIANDFWIIYADYLRDDNYRKVV